MGLEGYGNHLQIVGFHEGIILNKSYLNNICECFNVAIDNLSQ